MSMEAQLQLRRNVEGMHAAFDDLESWMGDIGSRDNRLRGLQDPVPAPTTDGGTDEDVQPPRAPPGLLGT